MVKSSILKVLTAIVIVCFCTSYGIQDKSVVESASISEAQYDKYIRIMKINEGNYALILLDKAHQIIFEAEYPVEPMTQLLNNRLIQVTISLGSPNCYVFFYDPVSTQVSEVYYNPLLSEGNNILYLDDEKKLIYRDIFDSSKLLREFVRDFSPTAVASNAVFKANILNDTLHIEYFAGLEFTEKQESIKIK